MGSHVIADRDATLQAERDINVSGSGVKAGRNVSLDAGRDVNVVAAQNSSAQQDWEKKKQSGIGFSSDDNGISAFIGTDIKNEKNRNEQQTAAASQIDAGENLTVNAKRDINQVGSDLRASNDITLTSGRNINIDAAREMQLTEQQREAERNGISATINHNFGKTKDAVNGAGKGEDNVSKGSSTLKAVDAVSQFLAGPTADDKIGNSKQSTTQQVIEQTNRSSTLNAGNDLNITANNDVLIRGGQLDAGRDINIKGHDITLDAAKGTISQDTQESQSWGGIHGGTSGGFKVGIGGSHGVASSDGSQGSSTVTQLGAGRDANLQASNDLNFIGAQVNTGRDIDLNAGNELNIRSAQNSSSSENNRSSGGGEAGFAFGSQGVGVYASVSLGKGKLEREGERQQEAYLYAGDHLGFSSGKDTNITGANLRGNEVVGRVGGDLNVSSAVGTGTVKGKEFDINATVTVGLGASVSGSVGFGETTGKTNWVEQQTSITAKDKVDIRTENHTQIDGALIASDSGNLKLNTGTLGFSDIAGKDREHGYYLNVGGSYDNNGGVQDSSQVGKGKEGKSGWSVEGYNYEKDREQIVRATVGGGDIVVRNDAETGDNSVVGLNRNVGKSYEVTKDKEKRTDLYASGTSVAAVMSPNETFNQWRKNAALYGEHSEEAAQKLLDLLVVTTLLPVGAATGEGTDVARKYMLIKEDARKLLSSDVAKRSEVLRILLLARNVDLGPDTEPLVQRLADMAGNDLAGALKAVELLSDLNRQNKLDVLYFGPLAVPLGAGVAAALSAALVTTSGSSERQEAMSKAANSVAEAAAKVGKTAEEQQQMAFVLWGLMFSTAFPIHMLDPKNSILTNPMVDAGGDHPSSGGYGADGQPSVPTSTGGSRIVENAGDRYTTPIVDNPSLGNVYSENVYVPSPKHYPGSGWGTPMDLDDKTAQQVLDSSLKGGKQQYGFYDGKLYEFQPDNAGGWHGYPIPGTEAPADVLRKLRDSGTVTSAEYNRLRKGKM